MRNLKQLFAVIAICLGIGVNAQAQSLFGEEFNLGIKAGVNFAGFTGDGAKGLDGKIGFNIGVFTEYGIADNIYLLSGLDFTTKGAKQEEEEDGEKYERTLSPMYLQIPIHVGYRYAIADNMSLGGHVGPYLAYGIGGKAKEEYSYNGETEKEEYDFFGSENEGGCKSFDFGLGLGVDFDYNQFRIGLAYDMGLMNIGRDDDYSVKNKNFSISVGYKF